MENKGCYVFYDPNGGTWPDGTTEPKPSPTQDGILKEEDRLNFPEGTDGLTRDGYRPHTSISFFNIVRYYSADGKGGGINTSKDYNNWFGYDYWPYNAMELSNNGHDENYFSQIGLGLDDYAKCTLYICWDPLIKYHLDDNTIVQDFVYKTGGDDYTILGPGDDTRYTQNRSKTTVDGYYGLYTMPSDISVKAWKDTHGNVYEIGKTYEILEPIDLYPIN